MIYESQGQYDDAIALLETSFMQQPEQLQIVYTLAKFLIEYGHEEDLSRAENLIKAIQSPSSPEIMDALGRIAYKRKDYDNSQLLFEKSLQLRPENPEYHYHLGMVLFQQGENAAARKHLQKATIEPARYHGLDEAKQVLQSIGS